LKSPLTRCSLNTGTKFAISFRVSIFLFIFFILFIILGILGLNQFINNPIQKAKRNLEKISNGDYQNVEEINLANEAGFLVNASKKVGVHLQIISEFVTQLSKGVFDKNINELLENNQNLANDSIIKSLIKTQETLLKSEAENLARTWSSDGLAKFTDLFRKNADNLSQLCEAFISELIVYLKANQGGIFLVEPSEDDSKKNVLVLNASYAYGRKKFNEKTLQIGEGLLGQAFLEKSAIYLTELPENYTYITSGMGEATPKSLLIMPLISNDEVLGILEIASLKELALHEREFIQKLAEVIAGTISTVKVNEMTKNLLAISQQKSEALQSQEEEMRQNLEELEATQEESNRKSMELAKRINTIDESGILSAELFKTGQLIQINNSFLELLNLTEANTKTEIEFIKLIKELNSEPVTTEALIQKLNSNDSIRGEFTLVYNEQTFYLKGAISVMRDEKRNQDRLLFFAADITATKKLLVDAEAKTLEMQRIRKEEKERSDFEINSVNEMMNIYMESNRKENEKLRQRIKELEEKQNQEAA